MHSHRSRAILFAVAMLTAIEPALAADHALGKRRFDEGRAHVREGRCDLAVESFKASLAAEPNVGAALNLGECLESLTRLPEAYDAFRAAQALAAERRDERLAVARTSAERIEGKLVRLALRRPAGDREIVVTVDGVVVASPRWGRVLVSAGEVHKITATAPGCTTFTEDVTARAGESLELAIAPGCDAAVAAAPLSLDTPRGDGIRTVGWVVMGVSGAVVVAGAVFGVMTFSARADLRDAVDADRVRCTGAYPGGSCDPSARADLQPLEDTATGRATAATILTTAGLIGLAGGLALVLLAPSPSRAGTLSLSPVANGLRLGGTW